MRIHLSYASETGNTRKLAEGIGEDIGLLARSLTEHRPQPEAGDLVFHGFWTEEGDADGQSISYLESLSGVTLALFGTASYRSDHAYYDTILEQVKSHVAEDVKILPGFMCLGREPTSIGRDLEKTLEKNPHDLLSQARLKAYQNAADHPNSTDMHALKSWANFLIEKNAP